MGCNFKLLSYSTVMFKLQQLIYAHLKLCKNFPCTKFVASWLHIPLSKEFDL